MLSTERQREKTYHAISYLIANTDNCFKKKLYKLLFLLDFEFFEEAGRKVTHYDYFAWKMGPVPTELQEAIETSDADLQKHFDISIEECDGNIEPVRLTSKFEFESKFFSEAELDLLEVLSKRWKDATAQELEDFTHMKDSPWSKVWNQGKGRQQVIPEEYALDRLKEEDREIVLNIANERAEVLANYQ